MLRVWFLCDCACCVMDVTVYIVFVVVTPHAAFLDVTAHVALFDVTVHAALLLI